MRNDTHIRLSLSRGKKITSGMNPKLNKFGVLLIVLANEFSSIYKGLELKLGEKIIANLTLCLDSKIHHNNLINNIFLVKIEANNANVDDALMLDIDGFVSETNSTNVFMIKNGKVYTPYTNACLPGITRATVAVVFRQ